MIHLSLELASLVTHHLAILHWPESTLSMHLIWFLKIDLVPVWLTYEVVTDLSKGKQSKHAFYDMKIK